VKKLFISKKKYATLEQRVAALEKLTEILNESDVLYLIKKPTAEDPSIFFRPDRKVYQKSKE